MQPEQPTQAPQPVQPPVTPVTPPTPPSPPASQPVPPTPASQPTNSSQSAPGQVPEAALKRVRLVGILTIILGVAQTAVGIFYALAMGEPLGLINCVFGAVYLGFGIKLRASANNVPSVLTSLKVIGGVIIVNIILALLSGYGVGLIPILVIFYATTAYKKLFDAGLITSRSPLTAKPKV